MHRWTLDDVLEAHEFLDLFELAVRKARSKAQSEAAAARNRPKP
jgi:hypothetical protein